MSEPLKAPFPWFGGKSRVAPLVWERFGDVANYVEPFFGSGAVLLGRPAAHRGRIETVNDKDGFVSNFWRAVAADPQAVAFHTDWPVNENDLNARHAWLVTQRSELSAQLEGSPTYCDAKIAGWWVAGGCGWIGSGFCSGDGPWTIVDDRLVNVGDAGRGINKQMPHVGNAGQGINKKMPHVGDAGRGRFITQWMHDLQSRMREVRVLSGDWTRCLSESLTTRHGLTGLFLDPPYSDEVDQTRVYATDYANISHDVRDWCLANGDNPLLRIALCGYAGEGHEALAENGWSEVAWRAAGGYARTGTRGDTNRTKERIWFSPACLQPHQEGLF